MIQLFPCKHRSSFGHATHCWLPAKTLNFPALQLLQLDRPSKLLNLPAPQVLQLDWPCKLLNLPAAQLVQADCPSKLLNLPTPQRTQTPLILNLPAAQLTQSKLFVVAQEHFTPNFVLPLFTALQVPVNGASVHTLDEHVFHVGDPLVRVST